MQKVLETIQRVRSTKSTLRQASIREKKGPSFGKIQVKIPHQRSPHSMKFEDRSHEETERQQRCAQSKAWNLAKNIYKLTEKDKATFFSPAKWILPSASAREPDEREFAVDSGARLHMVSEIDLNSAELETMRTSRSQTTVMTANGDVQIKEEATVYVNQLDLSIKFMLLEETPAVFTLGRLCDDHGYTYHWFSSQKPHLIKNGKRLDCNIFTYCSDTQKIEYKKEVEVRVKSFIETRCIIHRNRKQKIENEKKCKEIYRMNCLIGYRSSGRIWLMKAHQQSFGETQSTEVKTLPSHLMNFQWSRE